MLKFSDQYVSDHVSELLQAAAVIIQIEREQEMTHSQRNHVRAVLVMIHTEIAKTVAVREQSPTITGIPF